MKLALFFASAIGKRDRKARKHKPEDLKLHKAQPELSVKRKIGACLFSATMLAASQILYKMVGKPHIRYFEYARGAIEDLEQKHQCKGIEESIVSQELEVFNPVPDLFLQFFSRDDFNKRRTVGVVSDWASFISFGIGVVMALVGMDFYLLQHFFFLESVLFIANSISENLTVYPPSNGLARCLKDLGHYDPKSGEETRHTIKGALDFTIKNYTPFNPFGTCTAMVWSGHTVTTMLGVWASLQGLMSALSRTRFAPLMPRWLKPGEFGTWWIQCIVILSGIVMATLVLFDYGHHSVDIFIGALLVLLTTQSRDLAYLATLVNPFLPPLAH